MTSRPSPEALARAEHENLIATFSAYIEPMAGGFVRHDEGIVLIAGGVPLRLFNQVHVESNSASPAALERAVRTARERRLSFVVNLRAGFDDDLRPVVERLGLVFDGGEMPGMALAPIPASIAPPADLDLRVIRDQQGFEDHALVVAVGFGMPEELVASILRPAHLELPGTTWYVGYRDGTPVVSGMGMQTGSTIGIYNIATVPEARRRGYGDAVTRRILTDGAAAGCDVGILQASDMGRPVYWAMGFRTVNRYEGWIDPPEAEAADAPAAGSDQAADAEDEDEAAA